MPANPARLGEACYVMCMHRFAVSGPPEADVAEDLSFVVLNFGLADGSDALALKLDADALSATANRLGELAAHLRTSALQAQGHANISATKVSEVLADVPVGSVDTVLILTGDNGERLAFSLPPQMAEWLTGRLQELKAKSDGNAGRTLQ